MELVERQLALFLSGTQISAYEEIVLMIKDFLKYPFLSPATFIPIPADQAPAEIPRAILQTAGGACRVQISGSRLDLFVAHAARDHQTLKAQLDTALNAFCDFPFKCGFPLNRIGVVHKYFMGVSKPGDFLAKALLKSSQNELTEMSLRVNYKVPALSLQANNGFQYEVGVRTDTGIEGIVVTRDFNSPVNPIYRFTKEIAEEFVSLAQKKSDEQSVRDYLGI